MGGSILFFYTLHYRLEWMKMSTNVKKGLVLLNVIFLLGLGALAVYQHAAINKTMASLEETSIVLKQTTKVLSATETKVKEQDENIKILTEDKDILKVKIKEQSDSLNKVDSKLKSTTEKLKLADEKKAEQAEVIRKLEEDLKKKIASRIASSAVPRVQSVSQTRKKSNTSGTSGMMTFSSTAYSYGTKTASGTRVQEGRTIAVDPNVIPLGSQVRIVCPDFPSINGVYTAEDTGGVVHGNIIDVYMQSYDRAIQYGRRTIYVEVL